MTTWGEQCPDRGPALSHAHWNMCDPKGTHPGTNERHGSDQCCHCRNRIDGKAPAVTDESPRWAPTANHTCGVPTCETAQTVIEQDERWTVVECPEHDARTRWESKEREIKEQKIIRPQDAWRQHGVSKPPK